MWLYFAGAEEGRNVDLLCSCGVRRVFVSYYTMCEGGGRTRGRSEAAAELMARYRKAGATIVVDSGAFSAMNAIRRAATGKQVKGSLAVDFDAYVDRYLRWLVAHLGLYDYFVEMDVQDVVGVPAVQAYRRLFRDRGLASRMWLVHHRSNTPEQFEEMVEASRVERGGAGCCAVGGLNFANRGRIDYPRYAERAYRSDVCIHAFASVRYPFLLSAPLTSSDSITWTTSKIYGVVLQPDTVRGVVMDLAGLKTRHRRHRVGFAAAAWTRSMAGRATTVDRTAAKRYTREKNVAALLAMERQLTEVWEARGIDWGAVEARNAERRAHGSGA